MTEWSKVHDWKSCVPKGTGGSNPFLSAMVLPTSARETRQARKGATVAVTDVWRGLFLRYIGNETGKVTY